MLTTFRNRNANPWSMIVRDLDQMFNSLPTPAREPWEYDRTALSPAYDIDETEDHYLLSFDVPGVSRDDLNIEITGNRLVVAGERKSKRQGKFQQEFTLPEGVTAEGIEAECRDGVLRLAIQKPSAAKPQKVKIGDGTTARSNGFLKSFIGEKRAEKQQEPTAMAN